MYPLGEADSGHRTLCFRSRTSTPWDPCAVTRVHWVSNETPDQLGQGGQRRQFFLIRALTEAGHTVRVISLAGPQDDTSIRSEADDVHRVPALDIRGRLPIPWRWWTLRRRLQGWGEVIVVAHGESWERFAWALPRGTPVIVDMHNIFSRWPGAGEESTDWHDLERRVRREAETVTVASAREAEAIPDGEAPVVVVEHGIDPAEWHVDPDPAPEPVVKLFGNWSWLPNARGLAWFVREIWPAVHAATGATCEIAGAGVDPSTAATPGVVVHGRVPDLQTFLSTAWVVAVPLPESVGAPVKYAEALAVGVPVITTSQGASGHLGLPLVADDVNAWIANLTRWLNAGSADHLAQVQRSDRLDRLSWTRSAAPLSEVISALAR